MYSLKQFEKALQEVGVMPGYEIALGKVNFDKNRMCVSHATGYLEVEKKPKFHYWNSSGECFSYRKNGTRIEKYDLKIN